MSNLNSFRDSPSGTIQAWEKTDDIHFTNIIENQREKLKRLTQTMRLRDECMHKMSNELIRPLLSLRLQLSSALKAQATGRITDEELRHRLEKAETQCCHLSDMISNLVDISRDDSGSHLKIQLQESNLCNVAATVLDRLVEVALQQKCKLILDCPKVVIGEWDPLRLDQIITQLVSNAIKHASGSNIEVRIKSTGSTASLEISDEGPGIPFTKQTKIFERFTKLDESTEGYGVGLWLVKELVERLFGSVRLVSWPGNGSTFTVELPLRQILH